MLHRRLPVPSLVLCLLVAACSDGGDSDPTSRTADPADLAADVEFLGRLAGAVDDEGELPLDVALGIIAAEVAPIAGVEPVVLADDDGVPIAVRRLLADWDTLTAQAQAVVRPLLLLEEPGDVTASTSRGPARRPSTIDGARAAADELIADLEARSGHDLGLRVRLVRTSDPHDWLAYATVPPGSPIRECTIGIQPAWFRDDAASRRSTLAHELWHCFQWDVLGHSFGRTPNWIAEGQAEWVGETIAGGTTSSAGRWRVWLTRPGDSLFRRSYDAIGLYAAAAQAGVDPFRTMLPMASQRGEAALQTLFGLAGDESLAAIARRLVRVPALGAEWDSDGPGITGDRFGGTLAPGDREWAEVELAVGAAATFPVEIAVPAGEVLRIGVRGGPGSVRVPGGDTVDLADGGIAEWCLRPGGCTCDDGSPATGKVLPVAEPGTGAAALRSLTATTLRVSAMLLTVEELCSTSLVGTWEAPYDTSSLPVAQPGLVCTGVSRWVFADDGGYDVLIDGSCTSDDREWTIDLVGDGTWEATDVELTLLTWTGVGSIAVTGIGQIADLGNTAPLPNKTEYTITPSDAGDVLTVSFTAPGVGLRTVQFTRVG